MVNFTNQKIINNDRQFYKKLEKEETNSFEIMCQILNNYEYIFLQNRRFLFVSRIKFAKKYSILFFEKKYEELQKLERFYLTYFIFCKEIIKAYTEFQSESNYQVFRKMTIEELDNNEKELINIDNKKKDQYNKLLNIYYKTPYYEKKEEIRKEFDKIPISTTIDAHGHYANLSSTKTFGFYKHIKEEYRKMNEIIYNQKFEYYYNENAEIKYDIFRKNDIRNSKFIFDQLRKYYSDLKIKDNYHANELYDGTYDSFVHFSNDYSQLVDFNSSINDLI